MYNFDGLYHNVICNVILIIVVLLFAGISLNNYKQTGKKEEKWEAIIFIIFAVYVAIGNFDNVKVLRNPQIESCEAKFEKRVTYHKTRRPTEYYFEGEREFYLDARTMGKLNISLEKGEKYKIYYEKRTRVIVGLEEVDT